MSLPWYKQFWPWFIISGPAAVLVAGAITMWLAFTTADGLVAEDYYKQGLAINKRLAREDAARSLGISAFVALGSDRIRVKLTGAAQEVLFVHMAHATRAGHDVRLRLTPVAPGVYETTHEALPRGH